MQIQEIYPRKPLSFLQRRKLEQQFADQVPLYKPFYSQKIKHENVTLGSSVGLALGAAMLSSRYFNPIAAIVTAATAFAATSFTLRTGVVESLFDLKNYNKEECIRAFNLWVYYTQENRPKFEQTVDQRYQEKLAQFREEYDRNKFETK